MQQVKEELSAGGVVYRPSDGKYLLGKHSGYHKWVLPKGLIEREESGPEAAVREVEEEVGVKAKIVCKAPIKTIEYWYQADLDEKGETTRRVKKYQEDSAFAKATADKGRVKVHKRVIFYLMELVEDGGEPGWEMEERKWVSFAEARRSLAFETEREVLGKVGELRGCL